jgi:hypothetical protein
MAEVNHFYQEENALRTVNSGSGWQNVSGGSISGASLAANTKYLVIGRCVWGGVDINVVFKMRLETADDSTIASKSETDMEFAQGASTFLKSWFFAHSYTTDASPADIRFQVDRISSTLWIDQITLMLIDLDDLGTEGTDYHEDIQAASGDEYSTTADTTVLAQIAAADLGITDEWLVLGYAKTGIGNTGRWFSVSANGADDASSASKLNLGQEEGEDTAENRVTGIAARHKAITSNVAFTVYGQEEHAAGNFTDQGAYLIALPGSLFTDFEHDYTAGAITVTTETTIATVGSYTPTENGNHLIIGFMNKDDFVNDWMYMHLEDGTTETRTGDSGPFHNQNWDWLRDLEPVFTMERISISAAKTYNLRANVHNTTFDAGNRWLLVLNLNKSPVPAGADRKLIHLGV